METKTTFVGSNGTIELNSESTVDLGFACVINPWDAEMDEALWLDNPFNNGDVLWIFLKNRFKRFKDFLHSLVKFGLFRVSCYDFGIDCVTGAHWHTFSHLWVSCAALMQTLSNGYP